MVSVFTSHSTVRDEVSGENTIHLLVEQILVKVVINWWTTGPLQQLVDYIQSGWMAYV